MRVQRVDNACLQEYLEPYTSHTVFTSFEWISFLEKNLSADPVVLELFDDKSNQIAIFVGMRISKFGIKILGSPFEGWLTPDMGFIKINDFDVNEAIRCVSNYAFKQLGCLFVQIRDKNIHKEDVSGYRTQTDLLLHLDLRETEEKILQSFTKNGRRDVRAAGRKGLQFKKVPFDRQFIDIYYDQLIEVFRKQNLNPNYSKEKLCDLVDAFAEHPEMVLALEAVNESGECAGTVFSFGYENWAYYMGAASYRSMQNLLPNEGLLWEMIKHWKSVGVTDIDLVGDRSYKHKYNPEIREQPVIIVERIPGLLRMKDLAKSLVKKYRSIYGMISRSKK